MAAYYNEHEPYAAEWLRNLAKAGHIPAGDVDQRSIVDVRADDLRGYQQHHFFAGVAGWALALRLAGWPDDRPVWTGSCPCQPFSALGTRQGFSDARHLWPAWFKLIEQHRPATLFGEQVAGAWLWLDAVFDDLERVGYACGAASLPAASVGAPHIRDRIWFVAHATGERRRAGLCEAQAQLDGAELADCSAWPAEPTLPRVGDGVPGDVAKRSAFGNAIVPKLGAAFIASFSELGLQDRSA